MIEANPRASRTVPFVSKAIGQPVAKLACRIMLGERIADLRLPPSDTCGHVCVKEAVLPFSRFAGADSLLGPEMRSTGEVMGIAADFPTAFAKAQAAAGAQLPNQGTVFLTVADSDKAAATGIASLLHDLGFQIIATRGTAQSLRRMGIPATGINKLSEGPNTSSTGSSAARWTWSSTRRSAPARAPTATRSARRPSPGGSPASRRCPGAWRRPARSSPPAAASPTWSRSRNCTAAVAPARPARRPACARDGRRPPTPMTVADRVQAPFGARAATIVAAERHGAYTVLRAEDPAGPRPQAGQFYMLSAAQRWGGGAAQRPFLPRAFSVLRAPAGGDELQFLIEDVGPGTRRLCELGAGDELSLVGPLGIGFAAPRDGRRAILAGGGVGIAPLAIWQDVQSAGADSIAGGAQRALAPGDVTVLLGFRDGAHAPGAGLLRGARVATDDGSAGHHGRVTDLLAAELAAGDHAEVYACGPPPMLEAVTGAVRRARGPRAARAGVRDGVRVRRLLWLRGRDQGRLRSPLRRRTGDRGRSAADALTREPDIERGRLLRHRACPSDHQRIRHV